MEKNTYFEANYSTSYLDEGFKKINLSTPILLHTNVNLYNLLSNRRETEKID